MYFNKSWDGRDAREYFLKVIELCSKLPSQSTEVLRYLFMLKNAQGQTPIHAWAKGTMSLSFTKLEAEQFLKEISGEISQSFEGDFKDCINAYDARGWTILHVMAAGNHVDLLKYVLKDGRANAKKRTEDGKCTPLHLAILHLAILHDNHACVLLLEESNADINATLEREICCGYGITYQDENAKSFQCWTPLQLAAIMGQTKVVRLLLKEICNGGIYNNDLMGEVKNPMPPLLLAAAFGDSETLRLFFHDHHFNPLITYEGATTLHFAVDATIYNASNLLASNRFLCKRDFVDFNHLEDDWHCDKELDHLEKEKTTTYNGRRECITILLQSGLDVWEKNKEGRFPEVGPYAPEDGRWWWHNQIASETREARRSLNEASNAIAIVAALVATTSFVGPLQPPLGYGNNFPDLDLIQATNSCIRVFVVSNSLSFYFAIASIMFAVVPYLPMPQESLYEEWQQTRSTISKAVYLLLMSVISVLVSFGAASNAGMAKEYSWQHTGLAFYLALLGGVLCLFGILLLFLRSLILMHPKNATLRWIYRFLGLDTRKICSVVFMKTMRRICRFLGLIS